jgi:hypothetical protein
MFTQYDDDTASGNPDPFFSYYQKFPVSRWKYPLGAGRNGVFKYLFRTYDTPYYERFWSFYHETILSPVSKRAFRSGSYRRSYRIRDFQPYIYTDRKTCIISPCHLYVYAGVG